METTLCVWPTPDANEPRFGRYDIGRCLARGATVEVYEATDTLLGDPVALKTVAANARDRQAAMRRLWREARLARRVTHPNVCRVFDFGLQSDGSPGAHPLPFLTMELLLGETLAQRLGRRGGLDGTAAREILAQVASGLAAIHRAGLVHGNLSSHHVFLRAVRGGPDKAVVMGLGRGAAIGGPAAAPPELAVDARALTALFCQMLSPAL